MRSRNEGDNIKVIKNAELRKTIDELYKVDSSDDLISKQILKSIIRNDNEKYIVITDKNIVMDKEKVFIDNYEVIAHVLYRKKYKNKLSNEKINRKFNLAIEKLKNDLINKYN